MPYLRNYGGKSTLRLTAIILALQITIAVPVFKTPASTITISNIIRKRRETTPTTIDAKSLIITAINVGATAKLIISKERKSREVDTKTDIESYMLV